MYLCTFIHCIDIRIASIKFHIVNAPVGKRLRIQLLIADNSRISGARFCTVILVQAEF